MSEAMIKGYRHTGVIVKNMGASLHFYRDLLGLAVLQDFSDDTPYINKISGMDGANVHMVKLSTKDGTVVELLEYLNHPTDLIKQPIYNVGACHLAFSVENIEKLYERLSQANVSLISEPVPSSDNVAKVCFCLDPNNVRIELVEMMTDVEPWDSGKR